MIATPRAREPEGGRTHARVWFVALLVGLVGIAVTAFGNQQLGIWIYTAAALPLAASSFRRVGALDVAGGATPALAGWALLLAAGLASTGLADLELQFYLPLAMIASQLMLLGLTFDPEAEVTLRRSPVPIAGHLAVAAGAALVVLSPGRLPLEGLLLGTIGFSMLLVEAYWSHPRTRTERMRGGWEDAFLIILAVSLLAVTFLVDLGARQGVVLEHLTATVLATMNAMVLFGIAVLAVPDVHVRQVEALGGPIPEMLAEVTSFILFLHAAFLAAVLAASWFIDLVFWGLTAWLTVAVLGEYAAVIFGLVRGRRTPPEPGPIEDPLTVVMAVRNEDDVLAETVRDNLELDLPLEFLLVPAESSTDGTVEVARTLAEEHPDRVQVEVGTGGSKAADLNQAWEHVSSDLVLVLDADEVVDPERLRWGLADLQVDESLGVVQGRKVGRGTPDGWLDRFIRVERRFSTRLDHVFQDRIFGAAHFAGSGALIRQEVPPEVGGWDPVMLTEDIDFSLRVPSESDWRIGYEPEMTFWETDPQDLGELGRQRGRWARGWAQVAARHLPRLLTGRGSTTLRERVGWIYQITTAVSAPWTVFLPLMTLLLILGQTPAIPTGLGIALMAFILPSRGLAYLYAYHGDEVNPEPRTIRGGIQVLLLAYLWILAGWILQIQALYLEISGAPRVWHPTRPLTEAETGTD